MRQNTWPICLSYRASCRAVDVRRFHNDDRKSSLWYWLLRTFILNIRRETQQEHFRKEAEVVEAVCLSRWSSWGASDACCFLRPLCWLLEASAEKRESFISSITSSYEYLSCEESVVIRKCFTWLPSGFSPGGQFPLDCCLSQCKTAKRNQGVPAP
jgi:hypothetical protein